MSTPLPEEHAVLLTGPVLSEKTALVTGASRGIGRAIALRLGRLGASVAICARSRDDLERTAASLRNEGIRTLPIVADVTHAAEVHGMIEQTCSRFGEVEILVNNAGLGMFGRISTSPKRLQVCS